MANKEFIYLIEEQCRSNPLEQFTPTGYYKAGMTDNKKERMEHLQTGNPRRLVMIFCTANKVAKSKERKVHDYLKERHGIRHCKPTEDGGQEWYYTQRGRDFIKTSFENGVGVICKEENIAHY